MPSPVLARAPAIGPARPGLVLLFAPDFVLPRLVPGFPPSAVWLGQLLAAAWLGVAALNWLTRATLLGGIYGRTVVMPNVILYFVSAMALLKADVWLLSVPAALFAGLYGWLLFRGPLERDSDLRRR